MTEILCYETQRVMAGTPLRKCEVLLYKAEIQQGTFSVCIYDLERATFNLVTVWEDFQTAIDFWYDLCAKPPKDLNYRNGSRVL